MGQNLNSDPARSYFPLKVLHTILEIVKLLESPMSPFGVALGFPSVQIANLAPDSVLAKFIQRRTVLPGSAQS